MAASPVELPEVVAFIYLQTHSQVRGRLRIIWEGTKDRHQPWAETPWPEGDGFCAPETSASELAGRDDPF